MDSSGEAMTEIPQYTIRLDRDQKIKEVLQEEDGNWMKSIEVLPRVKALQGEITSLTQYNREDRATAFDEGVNKANEAWIKKHEEEMLAFAKFINEQDVNRPVEKDLQMFYQSLNGDVL